MNAVPEIDFTDTLPVISEKVPLFLNSTMSYESDTEWCVDLNELNKINNPEAVYLQDHKEYHPYHIGDPIYPHNSPVPYVFDGLETTKTNAEGQKVTRMKIHKHSSSNMYRPFHHLATLQIYPYNPPPKVHIPIPFWRRVWVCIVRWFNRW